jgi:hypothetical protein
VLGDRLGRDGAEAADGLLDPADRFTELRGVHRRGEHVAHAAADRPLEQLGGQLLGDEDGADVRAVADELLHAHEPGGRGAGGAEHDHGRVGSDLVRELLDGRVAGHLLAELHGEPVPRGLVVLHHDQPRPRLGHRIGHVADSR